MDELFWGRDHEDVNDWAERLNMAAEVRDFNADKLFKIAKLNVRGRAKDWYRRLQPAPADWDELRTLILQKYGGVDADDITVKLDAIKQEPRERVQRYFEHILMPNSEGDFWLGSGRKFESYVLLELLLTLRSWWLQPLSSSECWVNLGRLHSSPLERNRKREQLRRPWNIRLPL